ncbi:hypothetical protein B0T25DRAFT_550329 [Lasiosphaeria hispida]|uniref:Uncharacterized protein n=1 Tax=Lasiosphaeria hispida TaxID=260671 RepID=A0AAJ0HGV3_9PEZI|nr:hypothetical protein B0T25DRAFT_550329 [Lasiosphaeria hispida]
MIPRPLSISPNQSGLSFNSPPSTKDETLPPHSPKACHAPFPSPQACRPPLRPQNVYHAKQKSSSPGTSVDDSIRRRMCSFSIVVTLVARVVVAAVSAPSSEDNAVNIDKRGWVIAESHAPATFVERSATSEKQWGVHQMATLQVKDIASAHTTILAAHPEPCDVARCQFLEADDLDHCEGRARLPRRTRSVRVGFEMLGKRVDIDGAR